MLLRAKGWATQKPVSKRVPTGELPGAWHRVGQEIFELSQIHSTKSVSDCHRDRTWTRSGSAVDDLLRASWGAPSSLLCHKPPVKLFLSWQCPLPGCDCWGILEWPVGQ